MSNLLKSLILVSEKAANIARICRQNEHLFTLLIEEKHNDANPRFFRDFKTLADVLIQETIRHDISAKFPELRQFIQGEENNTFSNSQGESITISVLDSEVKTSALLSKVCGGDDVCARILAKEVHQPIAFEELQDLTDKDIPLWEVENINDLGIWIDPIDSTNEYIKGVEKQSEVEGIPSQGLACATVLIGAYSRSTGIPKIGIVNQPFHKSDSNGYKSRIYWGVSHLSLSKSSVLLSNPIKQDPLVVALSGSEQKQIVEKLTKNGVKTVALAGAGYKILSVILGNCDCFVLSKSTTYKWDTCGPHAILNSMGGGIIEFTKAVSENCTSDNTKDCELKYIGETKNSNGLIAYKSPDKLKTIINILKN